MSAKDIACKFKPTMDETCKFYTNEERSEIFENRD